MLPYKIYENTCWLLTDFEVYVFIQYFLRKPVGEVKNIVAFDPDLAIADLLVP